MEFILIITIAVKQPPSLWLLILCTKNWKYITKFLLENLRGRDCFGDLRLGGRVLELR
jgi:hypothetical protein